MRLGMLSDYFDVCDRGADNDLCTTGGLLIAIRNTLRIVEGGLLYGGVPCNSFIFMNSRNTQRTDSNPLGNKMCPAAVTGNILASRFMMLVLIALARKVYWFVEQPGSSKLKLFPYTLPLLQSNILPHSLVRWTVP
jgi:hypothetical protein